MIGTWSGEVDKVGVAWQLGGKNPEVPRTPRALVGYPIRAALSRS